MVWTELRAARFHALRPAEAHGTLTDAERAELDVLLAELDTDEADALRSALERVCMKAATMAEETASLATRAWELQRIAKDEERLLDDARAYLEQLRLSSAELILER